MHRSNCERYSKKINEDNQYIHVGCSMGVNEATRFFSFVKRIRSATSSTTETVGARPLGNSAPCVCVCVVDFLCKAISRRGRLTMAHPV